MDYKLLLDTAVMAGEILLESGAETWRVEDTMLRMLRMSGACSCRRCGRSIDDCQMGDS